MKIEPYVNGHAAAPPEPVTVVWGAHTDDHWYRLDITLDRVMHVTAPPWMGYEFRGAGPVENVNIAWALRPVCARLGLAVAVLSLVEITAGEYAALTETRGQEG